MKFRLAEGGALTFVAYENERITLRSKTPYPPGSPVQFWAHRREEAFSLLGKTNRCRKIGDSFQLELRLVSMPKSTRVLLEELTALASD